MKFSVVKEFKFCAAHRLVDGYSGKCANLHGHNWVVRIELCGENLDQWGMLKDFNDLAPLKNWIDLYLDHGTLYHVNDHALADFLRSQKNKCYPIPGNPTSENVAKLIAEMATDVMKLPVASVEIDETCTCTARYEP